MSFPDMEPAARAARRDIVDEAITDLVTGGGEGLEVAERLVCLLTRAAKFYNEVFPAEATANHLRALADLVERGELH